MKLDKLYSLRRDFTVIGLTGRTGSGCTKIAELLSKDFKNLDKIGKKFYYILKDLSKEKGNEIIKEYL